MQTKLYKRKCHDCGNEFQTNHKISYCDDCYKIKQKERYRKQKLGIIPKPMGRCAYPLNPDSARVRFLERRKELEKIKVREEWIELLRKRFTDLLTNETEIYDWAVRTNNDTYYQQNKQRYKQRYHEKKKSKELDSNG